MGKTEWALLILLSIFWGSSFFFMKVALQSLSTFTIVFARVGIAALLLIIYVYATGQHLPGTAVAWKRFIILGTLRAALPISLIVWAETRIDSNLAGILNSTSPLFTAVIAHYLTTDDKLTSNRLLGIVIGMFGVSILIGPDALRGLGSQVIAQLAMLGATCSYGFAAVYGRQFKGTPPAVSAAGMLAGATILTLPLAALEQPWTLSPSLQSLGAILGLSFLSTALAFIIWFQLIFRAGASNTSMVTFLIPITALTLGILFLHEEIVATSIIGLMTILGGLAVAQNRWFKRFLSIKQTGV
ncbi:MAG: DMT family transporter [Anaerolineaceae bacterium]|nr:DMT family transporter [Anaerolineaceae bacterium]